MFMAYRRYRFKWQYWKISKWRIFKNDVLNFNDFFLPDLGHNLEKKMYQYNSGRDENHMCWRCLQRFNL